MWNDSQSSRRDASIITFIIDTRLLRSRKAILVLLVSVAEIVRTENRRRRRGSNRKIGEWLKNKRIGWKIEQQTYMHRSDWSFRTRVFLPLQTIDGRDRSNFIWPRALLHSVDSLQRDWLLHTGSFFFNRPSYKSQDKTQSVGPSRSYRIDRLFSLSAMESYSQQVYPLSIYICLQQLYIHVDW